MLDIKCYHRNNIRRYTHNIKCSGTIELNGTPFEFNANIKDISNEGICLQLIDDSIHKNLFNSDVSLNINSNVYGLNIKNVKGRVRWPRQYSFGQHGINSFGVRFEQPIADSNLQKFYSDRSLRKIIRENVKYDLKNDSLYKYLCRVLNFIDGFLLNSDIALIGFLVEDDKKRNIEVRKIRPVKTHLKEFNHIEPLKVSELDYESDNFTQNQNQKYSCMAYTYLSEDYYLLHYPDSDISSSNELQKHFKRNSIKNMRTKDIDAAHKGKFIRFNNQVISDLTIPIKPWCSYQYKDEYRIQVREIFKRIREKCPDWLKVFDFLDNDKERDTFEINLSHLSLVNDSNHKGNRILLHVPINTQSNLRELSKLLKEISVDGSIKNFWFGAVDSLYREAIASKVVAFLNFELLDDTHTPPEKSTVKTHGFGLELSSLEEIIKVIRTEIEIEISNAFPDTFYAFPSVLYHSLEHFLMGNPNHAMNELGKWRHVQCRTIFRNYPPLEKLFKIYQNFFTREKLIYQTGTSSSIKGIDAHNYFVNLLNNYTLPDKEARYSTMSNEEKEKSYLFAHYILIPTIHVHNIKGILINSNLNDKELLCRKIRNISSQIIKPNILHNYFEKNNDYLSFANVYAKNLKNLLVSCRDNQEKRNAICSTNEISSYWGLIDTEKDDAQNKWTQDISTLIVTYITEVHNCMHNGKNELSKYLNDCKLFNDIYNSNSNSSKDNISVIIDRTLHKDFFQHLEWSTYEDPKIKRRQIILKFLLEMDFLTSIPQIQYIIGKKEEFETRNPEDREFIYKFIAICSILILSELVNNYKSDNDNCYLTLPLSLAYLYRSEAFLLLGQNHRAFYDLIILEKLLTNHRVDMGSDNDIHSSILKPRFSKWLRVLLNYHKGRIYFASFSKAQSVVYFCRAMELIKEYEKEYGSEPRYLTFETMIFKGKTFFESGCYSRAFKWYLKSLKEILHCSANGKDLEDINKVECCKEIDNLVKMLEMFEQNGIIKKDELIQKLDSILLKIVDIPSDMKALMAKVLSDVLNRIGFILFDIVDINQYEYPMKWISEAEKLDSNNGFSAFNHLLIEGCQKLNNLSVVGNRSNKQKYLKAFRNMGRQRRKFYPMILHWISEWKNNYDKRPEAVKDREENHFYLKLLYRQLRDIDDLVEKPAEIYEYLTRVRILPERKRIAPSQDMDGLYFLNRYSSWSPKLPRPRIFSVRGGGKFLVWKGKGILIDPGFDLLMNLYAEGFSLEDIDAVIITHDHLDHTGDFEALWRLIKDHNKVIENSISITDDERNNRIIRLTLFVNQGFEQKCLRFLTTKSDITYVDRVYTLSKDSILSPEGFSFDIRVFQANHEEDLTDEYAIGFILDLKDGDNCKNNLPSNNSNIFRISFTSDTRFQDAFPPSIYDSDIIVANISHATFRELKTNLEFDNFPKDNDYSTFLENLAKGTNQTENDIVAWALWYGRERQDWLSNFQANENVAMIKSSSFGNLDDKSEQILQDMGISIENNNLLICHHLKKYGELILSKEHDIRNIINNIHNLNKNNNLVKHLDTFFELVKKRTRPGVLSNHLGVTGVYQIWKILKDKDKRDANMNKLLILTEFREEMSSFRHKVARYLNKEVEGNNRLKCFTADVGMAIKFIPPRNNEIKQLKIQCSYCSHDNDLYVLSEEKGFRAVAYPEETFYPPEQIHDLRIKGEGERIFYFCDRHIPSKHEFFENVEVFDLFSGEGLYF